MLVPPLGVGAESFLRDGKGKGKGKGRHCSCGIVAKGPGLESSISRKRDPAQRCRLTTASMRCKVHSGELALF